MSGTRISVKYHLVFEVILLCLIVSFSFLTILAKQYPYFSFDLSVTRLVQQINDQNFLAVMQFLTDLGYPYLAFSSISIAVIWVLIRHNRAAAVMILISSIGGHLLTTIIKALVDRPRPDQTLIHQIDQLVNSSSFPSGHVMYFISFYGFLSYLAWVGIKQQRLRILVCSLLAILVALISVSRIYLGAHWFSDVMGSYLIGLVWLYVVIRVYRNILTQKLFSPSKITNNDSSK